MSEAPSRSPAGLRASRPPLLAVSEQGLYCAAGDFHIDPWRPAPRAVITHGHADHARRGSAAYLAATTALPVLRLRLGPAALLDGLSWG